MSSIMTLKRDNLTVRRVFIAALYAVVIANPSIASVTEYTNPAQWQAHAGPYSAITFTELPNGTWITDQYADLGVHFTDGSDQIYNNTNIFVDGFGLSGAFDESTLEFDAPMTAIAVDFPGTIAISLFSNGQLIHDSFFTDAFSPFAGLISTQPFDEVLLYDPLSGLVVDSLYFGPSIPAPPMLVVFGMAALCRRDRRRS